jgi:hypothetical protein
MMRNEVECKRAAYRNLLAAINCLNKVYLNISVLGKPARKRVMKCILAVEYLSEEYCAWGDSDD